jgi:hypothetical protein
VHEPSRFVLRCAATQRIPPCVAVRGPAPATSSVYTLGGGAFSCSWLAVSPGLYAVSVLVDDQHVEGSPFAVMAHPVRAEALADCPSAGAKGAGGWGGCCGAGTGAQLRRRSHLRAAVESQAASHSCGATTPPPTSAPGRAVSAGIGGTPEWSTIPTRPVSLTHSGRQAQAQDSAILGCSGERCTPASLMSTGGSPERPTTAARPVSATHHGVLAQACDGAILSLGREACTPARLTGTGKAPKRPTAAALPVSATPRTVMAQAHDGAILGLCGQVCAPASPTDAVVAVAIALVAPAAGPNGLCGGHGEVRNEQRTISCGSRVGHSNNTCAAHSNRTCGGVNNLCGCGNSLCYCGESRSPRDGASKTSRGGAWRSGQADRPTRQRAVVKPTNRLRRVETEQHDPPRSAACRKSVASRHQTPQTSAAKPMNRLALVQAEGHRSPPLAASCDPAAPRHPALKGLVSPRLASASFLLGPSNVPPGGTAELLLSYPGFGQRDCSGCVVVTGVSGPARATTSVSEREDGVYSIAVAGMSVSGSYLVHASVDGLAAVGSPHRLRVGPLGACAGKCYACVGGVATAGSEAEVLIVACDRAGQRLSRGGARFEAWLQPLAGAGGGGREGEAGHPTALETNSTSAGAGGRVSDSDCSMALEMIPVQIHDCNDGTHAVRFTATCAGIYALHVQLGGVAISGSPVEVEVAPGHTSAANSLVAMTDETGGCIPSMHSSSRRSPPLAVGEGVADSLEEDGWAVAAGSVCTVRVTPRDSFGNCQQAALTEPWRVELERLPVGKVSANTGPEVERSSGFTAARQGSTVLAASPDVRPSAVRPPNSARSEARLAWSTAKRSPIPARAGAWPAETPLSTSGDLGHGPPSPSVSAAFVEAWRAEGPLLGSPDIARGGAQLLPISSHFDGGLVARFRPMIAGLYRLSVLLAGAHAGVSPFCCRVRHGAVDPVKCDLLAPMPAAVPIGTCVQLTVVLRDRFGNPCIGAKASEHLCTARVRPPLLSAARAAAPPRVLALPGGRHRVMITLGVRGSHSLRLFVDGVCVAAACDVCVLAV